MFPKIKREVYKMFIVKGLNYAEFNLLNFDNNLSCNLKFDNFQYIKTKNTDESSTVTESNGEKVEDFFTYLY